MQAPHQPVPPVLRCALEQGLEILLAFTVAHEVNDLTDEGRVSGDDLLRSPRISHGSFRPDSRQEARRLCLW